MLLLAVDTAGPNCAVALAASRGGAPKILASTSERVDRGHAEHLMPMIAATLARASLSYSDLDRIAVTTGPGSFTGVRVGIATARALALALDIPAVGVGSLAALASAVLQKHTKGTAVAALDAKRGEVYVRVQDVASGTVLVEAAAMRVEDIAAILSEAARPIWLSGSGAAHLAGALSDPQARVTDTLAAPEILAVALLGLRASAEVAPVPLYARGADAKPQFGRAVARA